MNKKLRNTNLVTMRSFYRFLSKVHKDGQFLLFVVMCYKVVVTELLVSTEHFLLGEIQG